MVHDNKNTDESPSIHTSHEIKEIEQEKEILKGITDALENKVRAQTESKTELEKKLAEGNQKINELEQEKNILKDISKTNDNTVQKTRKKPNAAIVLIGTAIVIGVIGTLYYENYVLINNAVIKFQPNYNSNYVIQDLQGNPVNTWVAWNIADNRMIHVHVTNTANIGQNMIDAIKDAILSTKMVSIPNSATDRGSQGSSTYYVGWQGAAENAYSGHTKMYIPQQFDVNGTPGGVGDIEIILTNDINPDGYSGYTTSLVDGNQILKSKITIFKASTLDPDRLEAIMRHEFGHALGLAHSTSPNDLMYPMIADYPYISNCDISTLKGLYNDDGNSRPIC